MKIVTIAKHVLCDKCQVTSREHAENAELQGTSVSKLAASEPLAK